MEVAPNGSKTDVSAVPSKFGPPKGNKNAATHYLRSTGWPKGTEHERRAVACYGRVLREAVLESGGKIDIVAGGLIQTAQRWERHVLLCARWLRREHDALTITERQSLSRETARASAERDRAVVALGLQPAAVAPKDAWEQHGQLLDALDAESEGNADAS